MSAGGARKGPSLREGVLLVVRILVGCGCLYQAAFTFYIGIADRVPFAPQALLAAALLSGLGARWALLIVGLVAALANLAPFLDIPVYPWFTLSHPLGNAVLFALCGLGWLASLEVKAKPAESESGQGRSGVPPLS